MQRPNSEKLNLNLKIDILRDSILTKIKTCDPIEVYPGYGGWSLTSIDATISAGWNEKSVVFNADGSMNETETRGQFKRLLLPDTFSHHLPTQMMTDKIAEVIKRLQVLGLRIARVRLSYLKPGATLYWHTDTHPSQYGARLHIPVQTNSECFFEFENEKIHLPADGNAYFLRINRRHRYINLGSEIRYHIIMDVQDRAQQTQYFRYPIDI